MSEKGTARASPPGEDLRVDDGIDPRAVALSLSTTLALLPAAGALLSVEGVLAVAAFYAPAVIVARLAFRWIERLAAAVSLPPDFEGTYLPSLAGAPFVQARVAVLASGLASLALLECAGFARATVAGTAAFWLGCLAGLCAFADGVALRRVRWRALPRVLAAGVPALARRRSAP